MKNNSLILAKITISILTFLFISTNVIAAEGCSDGTRVYPNPTGTSFSDNPPNPPFIPYYFNTNPITIQTFASDTQCGLQFGTFDTATHGRCQIQNNNGIGYREGAGLVYYEINTNTCPIDDYVYILLIAVIGIGFSRLNFNIAISSTVFKAL